MSRIVVAIILSTIIADAVGVAGGALTGFSHAIIFEQPPAQGLITMLIGFLFVTMVFAMPLGIPGALGTSLFIMTPAHLLASRLHITHLVWYVFAGLVGGVASLYLYSPMYTGLFQEKYFPSICGACLSGGVAGGFIYWKAAVRWPVTEPVAKPEVVEIEPWA